MGRPCLERHYLPYHGKGRLLDFGCGGGEFLLRMRNQGWSVRALDSSERVISHLRTKFGLRGFVGSLPHPGLALESFDVITMWASLEHVHEPVDVLRSGSSSWLLAVGFIYKFTISTTGIDRCSARTGTRLTCRATSRILASDSCEDLGSRWVSRGGHAQDFASLDYAQITGHR